MRRATVGDIAKVVSGGTPSRDRPEFWGGCIPWVKTGAIDFCLIKEADEKITEAGLENSSARIIPAGTILMAMYGQGKTRGQVAILGIDAAINQACAAILLEEGLDRDFIYQQLVFRYTSIRKMSNSGGQNNLNADLVRNIPLRLPDEPEQRKIGEVLMTWDRAISNLESIVLAKSLRKRGLMQQLLTGRKRIKEFKSERWKSMSIGDVLEPQNRYERWDDTRIFKLAGVRRHGGGLFFRDELPGSAIKVKTCKKVRTGDFLISRRQMTYGGMAMVPAEFDGFDVNDEYEVLVVKGGVDFDMRFFNYLSHTASLKHAAYVASNGFFAERLRLNLDLDEFLGHRMMIPSSRSELRGIVAILDLASREIDLLQKQLAALKEEKRCLMQKLLTGEIRVKA